PLQIQSKVLTACSASALRGDETASSSPAGAACATPVCAPHFPQIKPLSIPSPHIWQLGLLACGADGEEKNCSAYFARTSDSRQRCSVLSSSHAPFFSEYTKRTELPGLP